MDKGKQGEAMFISFCIEQYAKAKNMKPVDVVDLFEQYGILKHLSEFYDVLHTRGKEWLVEEIDEMIKSRRTHEQNLSRKHRESVYARDTSAQPFA